MSRFYILDLCAFTLERALEGALLACSQEERQQLDAGVARFCVAVEDLLSPCLDAASFSVVCTCSGKWPRMTGYVLIGKNQRPCRRHELGLCFSPVNVLRCFSSRRALTADRGMTANLCRGCLERVGRWLPGPWKLPGFD